MISYISLASTSKEDQWTIFKHFFMVFLVYKLYDENYFLNHCYSSRMYFTSNCFSSLIKLQNISQVQNNFSQHKIEHFETLSSVVISWLIWNFLCSVPCHLLHTRFSVFNPLKVRFFCFLRIFKWNSRTMSINNNQNLKVHS